MKITIAMDSFKGSITAMQACNAVERGVLRAIEAQCIKVPFADGGEGTVDSILMATQAKGIQCETVDPLNRPISAEIAWFQETKTAVVEMAQASGLCLLEAHEHNPLVATTWGTGVLIDKALNLGCKTLIIGLGGSATNDGGAGALAALGARFYNKNGELLGYLPCELVEVSSVELSGLDKRLSSINVIIASDVQNVLCGENGATAVYGPQKGVTQQLSGTLDQLLNQLGNAYEEASGKKVVGVAGAGAAGGVGAALLAAMNAQIVSGAQLVSEICNLEKQVKESALLITGEGAMDAQTLHGKAPIYAARLAQKYGIKAIGFCGTIGEGNDVLLREFASINSIVSAPMSIKEAMDNGEYLLEEAVWRFFVMYKSFACDK